MEVLRTDVAIIGGGLGACAAALAAARLGRRVILTEETHWIGGQLTNQAVPPDEHPWIESFGATASYRALARGDPRLLPRAPAAHARSARATHTLNPGNGWVSRLCHDPRIAVAVLHQMMIPHQLSGRLFVMHPHRPILAWTDGDRITGVVVRGLESGRDSLIEAPFFIDATPYGDLLGPRRRGARAGGRGALRDRRAPRRRARGSAGSAGHHGLLRDGASRRRGPHHRQAAGSTSTGATSRRRVARPLLELDDRPAGDARAADPLPVRGRGRSSVVAIPADPRPRRTSSPASPAATSRS